jgi:hypothetical protein
MALMTYTAIIGGDRKVLALHKSPLATLTELEGLETWHTSLVDVLATSYHDAQLTLRRMGYYF